MRYFALYVCIHIYIYTYRGRERHIHTLLVLILYIVTRLGTTAFDSKSAWCRLTSQRKSFRSIKTPLTSPAAETLKKRTPWERAPGVIWNCSWICLPRSWGCWRLALNTSVVLCMFKGTWFKLRYQENQRPTASAALEHPWFQAWVESLQISHFTDRRSFSYKAWLISKFKTSHPARIPRLHSWCLTCRTP